MDSRFRTTTICPGTCATSVGRNLASAARCVPTNLKQSQTLSVTLFKCTRDLSYFKLLTLLITLINKMFCFSTKSYLLYTRLEKVLIFDFLIYALLRVPKHRKVFGDSRDVSLSDFQRRYRGPRPCPTAPSTAICSRKQEVPRAKTKKAFPAQ